MPSHTENKILSFSAQQILDLVMDIESYPKFLPWCLAARINKRIDENNLIADLVINFKGFTQKYTSDVRVQKISETEFLIDVIAIDGPFKSLVNKWKIKDLSAKVEGSKEGDEALKERSDGLRDAKSAIEFFIDFEFNSIFLEKMIGLIFEKATAKMIDAFEKRAAQIYG